MLNYGYYNVAAATIDVQIGDVEANTEAILKKAKECREQTDLLVFPELCISGYTCGDLFFESALLDACEAALERLCRELPGERMVIVGVPLRQTDRLYNCAAVLFQGKIIGIQVKSYIPITMSSMKNAGFPTVSISRRKRSFCRERRFPSRRICSSAIRRQRLSSASMSARICGYRSRRALCMHWPVRM